MLTDISSFAKDQIIDFGLLERGLRKRLLKKGDKKKNVEEYFGKVLNSLNPFYSTGYGLLSTGKSRYKAYFPFQKADSLSIFFDNIRPIYLISSLWLD